MGVAVEKELGTVQGEEMLLNIGPQPPSTHGVLRLRVKPDGEIITEIIPYIGYLHRCFEKHCENLTYEQAIPFTDRCDYIGYITVTYTHLTLPTRDLV